MSELRRNVQIALNGLANISLTADHGMYRQIVENELHRLTAELEQVKAERDGLREDAERWSYLVCENNKGMHGAFRIVWDDPNSDDWCTSDGTSCDGFDAGAIVRVIDKARLVHEAKPHD